MQRLGGVVILMQQVLDRIAFLVGDKENLEKSASIATKEPFNCEVIDFLQSLSRKIMGIKEAKAYSDLYTFAFWIRKSSMNELKTNLYKKDNLIRYGRGLAFHIAPSNVAVNFAYSLAVGLITGNANVVRIPSKEYRQVDIIVNAINDLLSDFENIRPYINLVRYERDKEINDYLSWISDIRIIWGGDKTIADIRNSEIRARTTEITFADRFSLAVIDSDLYMKLEDKAGLARDFYNDTYLSDQNACTSPRLIVWMGNCIEKARDKFWEEEYKLIKQYSLQPVMAVNKVNKLMLLAMDNYDAKLVSNFDNRLICVKVSRLDAALMNYKESCGFFFEYNCQDISELREICSDKGCQTVAYLGDREAIVKLLELGIKGIDRIVKIGHTMDFNMIWDGYDLINNMTRIIYLD